MSDSLVARLIVAVGVLTSVVIFDSPMSVSGVQTGSKPSPQQKSMVLPIVEVVGCLSTTRDGWVLVNGSDPVVSQVPFTTAVALKEARSKPLGKRQYRLLGAADFAPEAHKSEKIVVKGVLINVSDRIRINVTSLQTAASTCSGG